MKEKIALILVGITGDLAQRKILPALSNLKKENKLPKDFTVVGITRKVNLQTKDILNTNTENLEENFFLISNSLENKKDFQVLDIELDKILTSKNEKINRFFYLSVPPLVAENLVKNLGESQTQKNGETFLLLEKPFGIDESTAKHFIKVLKKYFPSQKLLFVDHYLAKQVAKDLISFRKNNPIIENNWNNKSIRKVEIIAQEKIDIEGRINFYEQTGALKDLIQSHLIQLAGLVCMPINKLSAGNTNLKELKTIAIKNFTIDKDRKIKRGQYFDYKKEVNNPNSKTETLAIIPIITKTGPLKNIPITLATGKALSHKETVIKIYFKNSYNSKVENIFNLHLGPIEKGELTINHFDSTNQNYKTSEMILNWHQEKKDGYENIMQEIFSNSKDLFASEEDIIASWKLLDPIQKKWRENNKDLFIYKKGENIINWL